MPATDEQLEIIFRYFDGELTDAEEKQLMQQLQQDKGLQQAFDQQVLMHRFMPDRQAIETNDITYEPADAFLNRVSNAFEDEKPETPVVRVAKSNFRWAAAAAVFACLLAAWLYYYFQHKNTGNQFVKIPTKDSLASITPAERKPDSLAAVKQPKPQPDSIVITHTVPTLQRLYADNYTVFQNSGIDVPVAAQTYQDLYEQQRYKLLSKKDENEMAVKGAGDPEEERLAVAYFTFYKALAFLQLQKPGTAIQLLLPLLNDNTTNKLLTYHCQWYLLMAYLQQNNKPKAIEVAAVVAAEKENPHQHKALEIMKQLNPNKKITDSVSEKDSSKKKEGFLFF